jgi:alkylation response protein AidB-like acyl-CoA dehydrogenase
MTATSGEEREAIRRTARAFAAEHLPISHFRALRDGRDATGFSREAWRELARLGLVGLALPERHGGAGLGLGELGAVLEELGRTLAPTPFLSTVLLGAGALVAGGTVAQRDEHLGAVVAGERVLAWAHDEGRRHDPRRVATRAEAADGGFRLRGEKGMVLDGHVADVLVVVARTAGDESSREGLTLFLVPARAPGVTITRLSMVDGRNAARVRFDGVLAGRADVIGEVDGGAEVADAVLDCATVALAAEMLGGIRETFDRTVAYLQVRRQFGVPIGSFQALQHRAAHLFCEVELLHSVMAEAQRAVDARRPDVPMLASAAKARASDLFVHAANEAVQMHGGVGVTDECDIGLFLKRARVAEMTLGDSAYHRDRFARLGGY